jgi:Ala-tRNA(Pro) deacylase
MPPLIKLQEYLDANHVEYEVLTHPEVYTSQELAAIEHIRGKELAKVVILRSGSEFLMIVLPAPYHVDLEKVRNATGRSDLSLATEQDFVSLFPNCEAGAMPPFGNLYDIAVWVDESLSRDEDIVFNACTHSKAIKMKYGDFARLVRPNVALLRMEAPAAQSARI